MLILLGWTIEKEKGEIGGEKWFGLEIAYIQTLKSSYENYNTLKQRYNSMILQHH